MKAWMSKVLEQLHQLSKSIPVVCFMWPHCASMLSKLLIELVIMQCSSKHWQMWLRTNWQKVSALFLADRTNGRTIGTVLHLSSVVVCLWRCVLWLNGASYSKSYYWEEVVYEKSIGTKMNDLDLCLEVESRSRQPLRYIWRWIAWKPLDIEVWFQRTTNRKLHMGYRMVTWPMTLHDLERSNSWPQYA